MREEDGEWWTLTRGQQGLEQDSEGCSRNANSAKSRPTEEVKVKGGTVSLNLKNDPRNGWGRGGSEAGPERKRCAILELVVAWRKAAQSRCNIKTFRGKIKRIPQRLPNGNS